MKPITLCGLALAAAHATPIYAVENTAQHALDGDGDDELGTLPAAAAVPVALFASLERYARIVDVAYCVGTTGTGIDPPFSCASRCGEFPELRLVTTWNTGVLMHDSCGYIAVDDAAREIVVAFRGTYSIANTVADLSTIPQKYVPYPGGGGDDDDDDDDGPTCTNCTVHMGFLASWESTRDIILPTIINMRNASLSSSSSSSSPSPPYRVHLVGHSLGGAVAALAGLEMKAALGWADVVATTFGEPRVGNAGLARFVEDVFGLDTNHTTAADAAYRRVTHKNDPVPLLPLDEWGYRSHAGEIFISKGSLSPAPSDVRACRGRHDSKCIDGGDVDDPTDPGGGGFFPPRLKLWELFYAHRDYFWRLGLCVPGGDPADWGRERYNYTDSGV
ncbi:triacylglycerol lipase fgl2 [Ophiostoma piceae UAMH 11346]|uniref:Triacylglycerol lipase fgl2 n=1 Tax=Ophiostoma piceae (strain UAMH 11346) TaxID=1262450 RepID=S3CA68_OPHP1|nr:triacylglycerol lipase fgl2 [Ophiostoma piceae UAMH 11346]